MPKRAFRLALVACMFLCAGLPGAELEELVREYQAAKGQVKGQPEARARTAREQVLPLLTKISALGSDEATAWLLREMREVVRRQPEVAAECGCALALVASPTAVQLALKELPAQAPVVQSGLLRGLAETKADLKPFEAEMLRATSAVKVPTARRDIPAALGRLESAAAAEALLGGVATPTRGARGDDERAYNEAVSSVLSRTTSPDVKAFLAGDAFRLRGSDPARTALVAELAGKLRLGEARRALEELIDNASSDVSGAALDALVGIGVGSSANRIATALRKKGSAKNLTFTIRALDALASAADRESLEVLAEFAKSKDATLRSVAMGSLGRMPGQEAADIILGALSDEDPSVRANALRALSGKRAKPIVSRLIRYLGEETEQRFKVDALQLLVSMTGQNMGLVAADWDKWWKFAEADFQFPEKAEGEGFTNVQAYDLEYFGIEIASERLTFIIDISSSMTGLVPVKERSFEEDEEDAGAKRRSKSGGGAYVPPVENGKAKKIDVLKSELIRVLLKLPEPTRINILAFDANFEPWQKELQPIAGQGRGRAVKHVRDINTGVGTNVYDSLEHALNDERVDTIYLLTDGEPTRGKITEPGAILKAIGEQNRVRGATIHCIAFGEESKFLEDLAQQNGGKYRFVDSY